MREDRDNCLAAGMDDYLSKPIEITDMLEMLKKWIPFDFVHPTDSLVIDIFDRDEFVRRNEGDLALSRNVITVFINSTPEYMESIRKALTAHDAVALRQSAHKLRGAAANLSLPFLSETARLIESIAESNDLEKASLLAAELEQRLEQAVNAMKEQLINPQQKEAVQ